MGRINHIYPIEQWIISAEIPKEITIANETLYKVVVGESDDFQTSPITILISKSNYDKLVQGIYHYTAEPNAEIPIILIDENNNQIPLINDSQLIQIDKDFNLPNGDVITLHYKGLKTKQEIEQNDVEFRIQAFITNHWHENTIENIESIRTILRHCQEKSLIILCKTNPRNVTEEITYADSSLISYKEENKTYHINWNTNTGINLTYLTHNDPKESITDYEGLKAAKDNIGEILDKIYKLQQATHFSISRHQIAMIEAYREFYGENPDFSEKDIDIKIQMMTFILSHMTCYGCYFDYPFRLFKFKSGDKMPYSCELEKELISTLYPYGKIEDDFKFQYGDKHLRRDIKAVGETIKEFAKDGDLIKTLMSINALLYVKLFRCWESDPIEDIANQAGITTNEVKDNEQLMDSINKKLEFKNY